MNCTTCVNDKICRGQDCVAKLREENEWLERVQEKLASELDDISLVYRGVTRRSVKEWIEWAQEEAEEED